VTPLGSPRNAALKPIAAHPLLHGVVA
jgi:hypothetical protein